MNWSEMPPLSMLRAFEAAARHGGFSAAGRELNVTHAAIAQQVRALEERLGLPLMCREGRAVAATPDGERLAATLREAFDLMREGVGALVAGAAERPVQVTMTTAFASSWLAPRLGAFRATHPDVELMLNPSIRVVDLARSEFDLAIRYGNGDWPGLQVEPLLVTPKIAAAAPDLVRDAVIETPRDLLRFPWVQELGLEEWRIWLAQRGIDLGDKRDILHLPGHLAIDALHRGQGIGLTARVLVEDDLRTGRLVALFEDEPGTAPTGYWVVRRHGRLRPGAKAFVEWLLREAREEVGG